MYFQIESMPTGMFFGGCQPPPESPTTRTVASVPVELTILTALSERGQEEDPAGATYR